MILLFISIIVIVITSIIVILAINSLDSFNENLVRINEAETNIETILNKRFDLLNKSIDTIKKCLKDDNVTLMSVENIRSQKLNNFELDSSLYECIKEFNDLSLDHTELKKDDDYTKIEIDLIETEAEILSLKQYYNDVIKNYNDLINKFPSSIIAKIKNYEIKEEFEIIDNQKLINKLK